MEPNGQVGQTDIGNLSIRNLTNNNAHLEGWPPHFAAILNKLTQRKALELITFDVFDTVLTNVLDHPEAVYFQVGRRLSQQGLITVTPEAFARARAMAERRIRAVSDPKRDVTLVQIYEELSRSNAWVRDQVQEMMACEMSVERQASLPVPGVESVLDWIRSEIGRIVFVSDMYLPTEFIADQLSQYGLLKDGDRLFVSGECGVRKGHNGDLLSYVVEDLGVVARHAIHVGNDWMVDVMSARKVGMDAIYLPSANLNRYERTLNRAHWESQGISSLYAGASRVARLEVLARDRDVDEALLAVCSGVAAPLIVDYTLWLLRRASDLGLKRLFFLAREGEVVFAAAQDLVKGLGLDIELRYLHVSRRALNLAFLGDADRAELEWALTGFENDTTRTLLSRLDLTPEELLDELSAAGFADDRWSELLTRTSFEILLGVFGQERIRDLIRIRAQNRRKLVDEYLSQQGFLDDIEVGLVDTTGVGSQFRVLQGLRGSRGTSPLQCFLMVRIWQPRLDYTDFPEIHGYYCDQYAYRRHYSIPGLTAMLEVFCAAGHGGVAGFRRGESGSVEPELDEMAGAEGRYRYTSLVRQVLASFVKAVLREPSFAKGTTDSRPAVIKTYSLFWDSPTRAEACAWGQYPLEGGSVSSSAQQVLAPPLSFRHLIRILLHDPSARFLGRFAWRAGSEQVSSTSVRRTILVMARAKRFARAVWLKFPNRIRLLLESVR